MHSLKGRECVHGDWAELFLSVKDNFSLLDSSPATVVTAGLGWSEQGRAVMRLGVSGRNYSCQL